MGFALIDSKTGYCHGWSPYRENLPASGDGRHILLADSLEDAMPLAQVKELAIQEIERETTRAAVERERIAAEATAKAKHPDLVAAETAKKAKIAKAKDADEVKAELPPGKRGF